MKTSVRILLRPGTANPFSNELRVEVVRGDLRNRETVVQFLRGNHVAFHTAALVAPWVSQPSILYQTNVLGTRWMLEAAEALEIPLVCTNSIVALNPYPPPFQVRILDGNHYVKSKRSCLRLTHQARVRGAKVYTVIPSGILGPGDHGPTAIGRLVRERMLGRGSLISFDGGLHLVDVRDVAYAHCLALRVEPGDYALPGEYWHFDRLYSAIGKLSGKRIGMLHMPTALALIGSAGLSSYSSLWAHQAPIITPAWVYYFQQAGSMHYPDDAAQLGLVPTPVEQSLEDAVSWFRAAIGAAPQLSRRLPTDPPCTHG